MLILLSNICKMKKKKSDCLTFTAHVEKSSMKKQTDDLVKRAKRHESEAFTELMQLYMTDMYKVAYAILMNDEDAADAIRDGVVITCTANYKDGTKKGAKINVGAAALTYEEIGMNVDGMTLQIEGEDEH
jgi:hypothetical protein